MTIKDMECGSDAGTDALPSALDRLGEIARWMLNRRLAVLLDYDGTLAPIVEHPGEANLSPDVRETLVRLVRCCTVAVISGRDLRDVRKRTGIDTVFFAGSHGFEIEGPGGLRMESAIRFLPVLDSAEQEIRNRLGGFKGAFVERKKYSIAVHYRMVAEGGSKAIEEAVDRVLMEHPKLRKTAGKKIYELQPGIEWHKGAALLWLLQTLQLDGPDVLPLYIGDDTTDEDALKAIKSRGIGIVVRDGSSRCTAARYFLENPAEVHEFLKSIVFLREERA